MHWFFLACTPSVTKVIMEPSVDEVILNDADGDGYYGDEDCDDEDASVNAGEVELCDGIDNNCDAQIDEGVTEVFFIDNDADGFGSELESINSCNALEGYVSNGNDCNDEQPTVYPGAEELCDELDNDCNSIIDDGVGSELYVDADLDGFGDPFLLELRCTLEDGYTEQGGDCDDRNNQIYPGALELCDELDNDCNNIIDDGGSFFFYFDSDSDGFGDPTQFVESCFLPEGYVSNDQDCNDLDTEITPTAVELCDGLDNNCDSLVDENAIDGAPWYLDLDEDGFGDSTFLSLSCTQPEGYVDNLEDCDDSLSDLNPDAEEVCDGLDNNCNSLVDEQDPMLTNGSSWFLDYDEDGFGNPDFALLSCSTPSNYVSNDQDCNDLDPLSNPDADEACDGVDNNCNNQIDEDVLLSLFLDLDEDGYGDPEEQLEACELIEGYAAAGDDCDDNNPDAHDLVAVELCDEADNNCNGEIDEGALLLFYNDNDADGFGITEESVEACEAPAGYAPEPGDCDDNSALVYPDAEEICDELDNNCNGEQDEGWSTLWFLDYDEDGYGDPDQSTISCSAPPLFIAQGGDCNDLSASYHPEAPLGCDGEDYNCDGLIDGDYDGDLFAGLSCGGTDCDDTDPEINIDAEEIWYDDVDQNCDGADDHDQDNDGYVSSGFEGPTFLGRGDCDDTDADIVPESDQICVLGTDCADVLARYPDSPDGIYGIDPDGLGIGMAHLEAYCDMTTDGGGWTLALNYLRQGSTNPALSVLTTTLPLQESTVLGADESSSLSSWGHAGNSLLSSFPISELMFFCSSTEHSRVIHFKTSAADVASYVQSGGGSMAGLYDSNNTYSLPLRNNSTLPLHTNGENSRYSNQGDYAMTNFPFYSNSGIGNPRAHWGIRGNSNRWECDNYSGNNSPDHTRHQVWFR